MLEMPPACLFQLAGPPCSSWSRTSSRKIQWRDALDSKVLSMPRTLDCFSKIELDKRLDYDLPPKNALAGRVLKHCSEAANRIIKKNTPLIFKFGYCFDAHARFYNNTFGYILDRDRWDCMLVLYAAGETISPAFVEASLIQEFKGVWGPTFINSL